MIYLKLVGILALTGGVLTFSGRVYAQTNIPTYEPHAPLANYLLDQPTLSNTLPSPTPTSSTSTTSPLNTSSAPSKLPSTPQPSVSPTPSSTTQSQNSLFYLKERQQTEASPLPISSPTPVQSLVSTPSPKDSFHFPTPEIKMDQLPLLGGIISFFNGFNNLFSGKF